MLQHNGRLANPLDPYTRAIKAISGKRKKTDEDLMEMMRLEARGACWETTDGEVGIPNAAVWRSIYNAATAFKRGEDMKRALGFADVTVPISVSGERLVCDEFVKDFDNIDYRPVVIQRSRTMRARPIVREWSSVHEFTLLEDVIDVDNLVPILERAGRLVGLGDWRPTYGTYVAEMATE